MGPVEGQEGGEYACLYQVTKKRGLVNSTVSNKIWIVVKGESNDPSSCLVGVHITVTAALFTDPLPPPTLVLQRQKEVWRLLCAGSPSYPGAVFSLYLGNDQLPVATHSADRIHHQVSFSIPVQDMSEGLYWCQYSVLLGKTWSHSGHSVPLVITRGKPLSTCVVPVNGAQLVTQDCIISMCFQGFPPGPPQVLSGSVRAWFPHGCLTTCLSACHLCADESAVDWPLVLGSFSAVMLFLCLVLVVATVVHRKGISASRL